MFLSHHYCVKDFLVKSTPVSFLQLSISLWKISLICPCNIKMLCYVGFYT